MAARAARLAGSGSLKGLACRRPRQNDTVATKNDRQHAAQLVRRLLLAVERGEIESDTPTARRLLRRLEGAVAAWESETPETGPRRKC